MGGVGWGGAFYSRDRKYFNCVQICTCTCVYAGVRIASIAADVTRKSSGYWMPICFDIRVGQVFWKEMVWKSLYALQTTHNSPRKQHSFHHHAYDYFVRMRRRWKCITPILCEYRRPCIAQLVILCRFCTDVSKQTNSVHQ